jgi:hypothetical protein
LTDTSPRTEKKSQKEKKNAHNRRTLAYGNVSSMKNIISQRTQTPQTSDVSCFDSWCSALL